MPTPAPTRPSAHLVGHGALDAGTARALAADAQVRQGSTDPASGARTGLGPVGAVQTDALDAHPYRYAIGAALARLVRLRDGRCHFFGGGVLEWTSPTGAVHTTLAHDHGGTYNPALLL